MLALGELDILNFDGNVSQEVKGEKGERGQQKEVTRGRVEARALHHEPQRVLGINNPNVKNNNNPAGERFWLLLLLLLLLLGRRHLL